MSVPRSYVPEGKLFQEPIKVVSIDNIWLSLVHPHRVLTDFSDDLVS
jgi:hypothetical protein